MWWHTDVAVEVDDKPSQALRHGRWKSSMWLAIDAVKQGEADVCGLGRQHRRADGDGAVQPAPMAGIERPAIAALWPTLRAADPSCSMSAPRSAPMREHLVDMAVMGSAMARVLFDLDRPTVGLLNIGVEEVKGLEEVARGRPAPARAQTCRTSTISGFVEGDDIGKGTVDVVVTEGFAGNIALKTAEGTARQIARPARAAMSRTWRRSSAMLLARAALRDAARQDGSAKANGGVFLGLNGVVIKSHGGTDAEGFAAAVDLGYDMVRYELHDKIERRRSFVMPSDGSQR